MLTSAVALCSLALHCLTAATGRARSAGLAPADTLTVFAASDLALAFNEIGPLFEKERGAAVRFVFGSTGNLVLQIRHGAPADVVFAANVSYVDQLRNEGLLSSGTQQLYARGRIVLATLTTSGLTPKTLRELIGPAFRKVAVANPEHAPYGLAAKQAMEHETLWEDLKPKIVFAESIRQTLQFLQSGAVDAAVIALSVAQPPEVRYVPIDEALYQPIDQALAVLKEAKQPGLARAFVAFVLGRTGRDILTRYGFLVPR
ncbi:MAG: molybdate ABC transporter substrate-binding protein [Gemmatimonadota bacterium]